MITIKMITKSIPIKKLTFYVKYEKGPSYGEGS